MKLAALFLVLALVSGCYAAHEPPRAPDARSVADAGPVRGCLEWVTPDASIWNAGAPEDLHCARWSP